MISESDKLWLARRYPVHKITQDGIACTVDFTATYNEERNQFLILEDSINDTVGGIKLSGSFTIRIIDISGRAFSRLPAVYVDGVDHASDRHFYQTTTYDACLCSPFEEDRFVNPEFNFGLFFRELVIPFLYGQRYFDEYNCWPWEEYSHGPIGLLESYSKNDSISVDDCIEKLSRFNNWKIMKTYLESSGVIKGHTDCFCGSRNQIRRCHPEAWRGVRKLKEDICVLNRTLP